MAVHGGCDCGQVRYFLAFDDLPGVMCCHCDDCQTRSGTAFDQTAFLEPHEIEIAGKLTTIGRQMRSGNDLTANFCGSCHTLIYNTNSASPGRILLRAGTLDDSQALVPLAHMMTKFKQAWLILPAEVPAFAEFPPAHEFVRIFPRM